MAGAVDNSPIRPLQYTENLNQAQMGHVETYLRSSVGLVLGIIPFAIHFSSIHLFKACISLDINIENSLRNASFTPTNAARRVIRIIPTLFAITSAINMSVSAKVFSLAQQAAWGQKLVQNPQEERINTQLARYGYEYKPWNDLTKIVMTAFEFCFLEDPSVGSTCIKQLEEWLNFTPR